MLVRGFNSYILFTVGNLAIFYSQCVVFCVCSFRVRRNFGYIETITFVEIRLQFCSLILGEGCIYIDKGGYNLVVLLDITVVW